MDLKIIEPIKNYLKEFKNVDEFNLYYSKNKEEIDSMTTHKLNKMYHIDGYRITKIKGKLCLKKYEGQNKDSEKVDTSEISEKERTSQELCSMKNEIQQLKTALNEIIKVINSYIVQEQRPGLCSD